MGEGSTVSVIVVGEAASTGSITEGSLANSSARVGAMVVTKAATSASRTNLANVRIEIFEAFIASLMRHLKRSINSCKDISQIYSRKGFGG